MEFYNDRSWVADEAEDALEEGESADDNIAGGEAASESTCTADSECADSVNAEIVGEGIECEGTYTADLKSADSANANAENGENTPPRVELNAETSTEIPAEESKA